MKTFLEYVAEDLLKKYNGNLANIAVVFPNKRAALFLNQALAAKADHPIWSPSYITISDLFRNHSKLQIADSIKVVCELHKSFVHITGKEETLDQFYGWGQLLLADFDDIDKNNADAGKVLANLKDLHEYDDISYLDDEQKSILKRFFSNFQTDDSHLQRRFIELWSRLYDIYADFRERLRSQGLAYEGMLYSEVANTPSIDFRFDKYIFIGFNVLQEVEKSLFLRLKNEGRAAFYWDFDKYYLHNNEAGVYIRKYIERFPNELDSNNTEIYDNLTKPKDITFISAATEDIQARYISEWLKEGTRIKDGKETAIILCNEGLLQTVIHCIPKEAEEINVTTGFPLQQTPIASLITQMFSLLYFGYAKKQDSCRLHHISMLLRHPYSKYISELSATLLKEINDNKLFYIKRETLCKDEGLSLLFGEIGLHKDNLSIINWMKSVVKRIAINGAKDKDQMFQESMFRMYTLLNRLSDLIESSDLSIDKTTLQRFVNQLINSTSIPFHGEPAVGVQIMGVLETRNLDFKHILVLSCNEGNMPKGVDDSSIIPHTIRKAYGLTTIDNKVAIYSYYFHSLLQRAKDVTILYNNSTEGSKTGEMSRFMLQLLVELGLPIKRKSLQAGQITSSFEIGPIEKSETIMSVLKGMNVLSPTAINKYLRCPLQFYYNYVVKLKEQENEDEDKVDNRIFGNIFHRAAQLMYENLLPEAILSAEPLERLRRNKTEIFDVVEQAISEELFNLPEGTKTHPELNGLQLIIREVIIKYLGKLLEYDKRMVPFMILAHESEVYKEYSIETSEGMFQLKVGGRIDRIDEIGVGTSSDRLRVVDYKSGTVRPTDLKSIEEVFDVNNILKKHSDYCLQAILYSIIESENDKTYNPEQKPVSPALLFIQSLGKKDYSPVLRIGGEEITDVQRYKEDFENLLKQTISEIYEPKVPFTPTSEIKFCQMCPYRSLCGR